MIKQKKSVLILIIVAACIALAVSLPKVINAGSLEPTAPPGPTMKTLDEIPPTWSQKLDSTDGDEFGCGSSRFECVLDYTAVLDKETGLVWARDANIFGQLEWYEALVISRNYILSDRKGFRLPTVEELASLLDLSESNPALPARVPGFSA